MDDPKPVDVGHNSGDAPALNVSADRLRSIVERFERLDEEVAGLRSDQKDLMQEAASAGFDKKVLRQVIQLRKLDAGELQERDHLMELYRRAVGL